MALGTHPTLLQINTGLGATLQSLLSCISISGETYDSQMDFAGWEDTAAPTIPTDFAMTNNSSTSIVLGWTASTDNIGIAGYKVYKDDIFYEDSSGTGTTKTLLGLERATSYALKLSAYDAAPNESGLSDLASLAATDREAVQLSTTSSSTSGGACALSSFTTWYHNGSGLYPVIGDKIYESPSIFSSNTMDGGGLWWHDTNADDSYEIDSKGVVQDVVSC